ncbi:TyeA family type III secretion system gatekeeper subunit [Pandoraea norimbergensis]|nr:TyeA family type III secretion system gatekeeper subunit [Pandoraea norimbergensis]
MVDRVHTPGNARPGGTGENRALESILDDEMLELEGAVPTPGRGMARAARPPGEGYIAMIESAIAHDEEAALAESQENLSLALGVRFRRPGRPEPRDDKARARALLEQQTRQLERVSAPQLDRLRQQMRDLPHVPDPRELIRRAGLSAGHAALVVCAWLADGGLHPAARSRLRRLLDELTSGDDWAIEAFAVLECGNPTAALLQQLKTLYRQAHGQQRSLVQWFDECRKFGQRRARLRALLQALGLELGAQSADADTAHLAAVIDDLRCVVLFLTLESTCEQSAAAMRAAGYATCETDTMIVEVLTLLDQPWAGAEWFAQRATYLGMTTRGVHYAFSRELTLLVKAAHDGCFRDETQRDALNEALDTWRTGIAQDDL